MQLTYAELSDIQGIKKIADKNKKYIGFVMKPTLTEASEEKRLLVLKDDNQIIGFCHYRTRKRDGVTVIYEICMSSESTGKGLGKMFLDELPRPLLAKCPEDNFSNKFYVKNNFELLRIDQGKSRRLNVWSLE